MKTKYAPGAKPNIEGPGDTSRKMPSVQLPSGGPLPTAADNRSYMYETPNANVTTPKDSESLAMFNASAGYSDSGARSEGDKGGAA